MDNGGRAGDAFETGQGKDGYIRQQGRHADGLGDIECVMNGKIARHSVFDSECRKTQEREDDGKSAINERCRQVVIGEDDPPRKGCRVLPLFAAMHRDQRGYERTCRRAAVSGEVYIIDILNRRKLPASSSREVFNPLSKRRSNVPYHRVLGPNFKFRPALTTLTLVVILTGNVVTVVIGHARPQVKPVLLLFWKP